ncbi:hypothetical protein A9K97_gp421 [Tokyovirus A1]|uniref:hypothetical protein n=1 Tax=Tokyovirus A1 TaxID=1826170 RepID=UPI0007A980A0|nr:hypothetical protein A9K97_gp421 [Tokyovirus A1]BAU79930.1 hypothetical protein [Tokyovirus A1]
MDSEIFELALGIIHQVEVNDPETFDVLLPEHREQTKSEILEDVLKYIQEHADVDKGDIIVEISAGRCRTECQCKREFYFERVCRECVHGLPFLEDVHEISASVSIKGWESRRDVVCYWREVKDKNKGTFSVYPFRFHEPCNAKEALPKIISVVGKHKFKNFRRKKFLKVFKETCDLTVALQETKEKNRALREEVHTLDKKNKELQNLLAEAYAPGGILAKEAQKHFESLS